MEPEADARHLCQFALFELEHKGDLNELMENIRATVYSAVDVVINERLDELRALGVENDWIEYLDNFEIGEITYTDAVKYLRGNGFPNLVWGDDLKADHEAEIVSHFGATFVTHYPLPIKFFNMKQNEDNRDIVNSCDLLLPFAGESAGAAERETQYDKIVHRLKTSDMYHRLIELGGKDEDFEWYLGAHKAQEPPAHAGAGIGMARVAQFILGADDIRNAVPFVVNRENLL
jgi:asparaginyl-tRNA synthetase